MYPSLSTDQIAALVELARTGSLRAAASELHITEQGVRNRLLALEQRVGVELYRKSRGVRTQSPLTIHGEQLLPRARAFLVRSRELCEMFQPPAERTVHVVASHYLIAYFLINLIARFHDKYQDIRVTLSARTESEVVQALRSGDESLIGAAALPQADPDLDYRHLFSLDWSLIAPPGHPLITRPRLRLADITQWPLIAYEAGSTGRQHVLGAFQRRELSPRVEMEATGADMLVRMVEAGLGVAIVPLMPSGVVTRDRQVACRSLGKQIEPIDSGLLTRKNEPLPEAHRQFVDFVAAGAP